MGSMDAAVDVETAWQRGYYTAQRRVENNHHSPLHVHASVLLALNEALHGTLQALLLLPMRAVKNALDLCAKAETIISARIKLYVTLSSHHKRAGAVGRRVTA